MIVGTQWEYHSSKVVSATKLQTYLPLSVRSYLSIFWVKKQIRNNNKRFYYKSKSILI